MKIWNQVLQETSIPLRIHQLLEVEHGMKEIKVSDKQVPLETFPVQCHLASKVPFSQNFIIESIWIIFSS